MYRHILWDMGGTLLDTYADVDTCLFDHVRRFGRIAQLAEVSWLTRVSIAHAIETLSQRYDIPAADLANSIDELHHRWERTPPRVADGAVELLEAVHGAGGLNLIVTHRDRVSAEFLLEKRDLARYIDDILCAPDGYARKPDPQMYHLMIARHGIDPAECLGVGDRRLDCEAALASGMSAALLVPEVPDDAPSVWDITTTASRPDLPTTTYYITGLGDLLPLFE
ncbi:MAG: HAD family hydrolase [Ancrocorticia sp.]